MLPQEHLIARVRELCHHDERLVAALTYGSFAQGEADAHSDIEFWLFFAPGRMAEVDPRGWCDRIGPVRFSVVNEFGSHVVFFPDLIRGEFHFATADDIASVATWPARGAALDRMVIIDRTGALRDSLRSLPDQVRLPQTGEEIEGLCGQFANWLVLAHHVAQRGEVLRAVDALSHVHRCLLWLARLAEGRTRHWLTPSRRAEVDLPERALSAIRAATAAADAEAVTKALTAAWTCGRAYWLQLARRAERDVPMEFFNELDATFRFRMD